MDQPEKIVNEANLPNNQEKQEASAQSKFSEAYHNVMNLKNNVFSQEYLIKSLKNMNIEKSTKSGKNQLQILSINTSKNSQIIELQIQLCWYVLKINIINLIGQSPLHSKGWFQEGTFGKIYRYTAFDGTKRAVKCHCIKRINKFEDYLFEIIREYGLMKIASTIECAPFTNFQNFNLFVYKNAKQFVDKAQQKNHDHLRACIEFQMEYCQSTSAMTQQETAQVSKSLYSLHTIGMTHNDLKYNNIMYSSYYNKWIFIDYGVSLCIKQKIGQSTYVSFRGTYNFCGPEMQNLYLNKSGYVDLYWNDLFGLQLSVKHLKKLTQTTQEVKVQQSQNQIGKHFLLLQLKYYLYFYNFAKIVHTCSCIKWQADCTRQFFYFLLEINYIPEELKTYLGKNMSWDGIQDIQAINAMHMFGPVTSSMNFHSQNYSKIKIVIQKQKHFLEIKQVLTNFLDKVGHNDQFLKRIKLKKQHRRIIKSLSNNQQVSVLKEQIYFPVLFQIVNFLKCSVAISLRQKVILCQVFERDYINKNSPNLNESINLDGFDDQSINSQTLQPIYFFFKTILNYCLAKPHNILIDSLPQIYTNFLMLGLGNTVTIRQVYEKIPNLSKDARKVCKIFKQVYMSKYWYQNVIHLKEHIDYFEVRKSALKSMIQICNKFGGEQDMDHKFCCQSQYICSERQENLIYQICLYSSYKENVQMNKLQQKLFRCMIILQRLKQNLQKRVFKNEQDQRFEIKGMVDMEFSKDAGQISKKINFKEFQIPLNTFDLFDFDVVTISTTSFINVVAHLEDIFNCKLITQFWLISVLKNLLYQFQFGNMYHNSNTYLAQLYFRIIIMLLQDKVNKVPKYIFYLISFYKMKMYFMRQSIRFIEVKNESLFFINKCEVCMTIIGDFFSPQQLAQYLVELSYQNSIAIWSYLLVNKEDKQRCSRILNYFNNLLQKHPCKIKVKVKQMEYNVFSNIYLNQTLLQDKEKRDKLQKVIFAESQCKLINFIKLKYIQYWIYTQVYKKQSANSIEFLQNYFYMFQKLMKQNDFLQFYFSRRLNNLIFNQYFAFLVEQQRYQEWLTYLQTIFQKMFRYISKQTYFLLCSLKCSILNYFFDRNRLLKWQQIMQIVVQEVKKKENAYLNIMNSQFVYLQLLSQDVIVLNKHNYQINNYTYQYFKSLLYRCIRLVSLMNMESKCIDVQLYYRCFFLLFTLFTKQNNISKRFLNYIAKRHKKVLQKLIDDNATNRQSNIYLFYAQRNKIYLYWNRSKIPFYKRQQSRSFITMLKQKLNSYYQLQSNFNNLVVISKY